MKVRQAYEGRVIEARSSELKNGGWDCEFSIEKHETKGVTESAFYVPGVFPSAEAAIEAAGGSRPASFGALRKGQYVHVSWSRCPVVHSRSALD